MFELNSRGHSPMRMAAAFFERRAKSQNLKMPPRACHSLTEARAIDRPSAVERAEYGVLKWWRTRNSLLLVLSACHAVAAISATMDRFSAAVDCEHIEKSTTACS
jgi:hypothetical protein